MNQETPEERHEPETQPAFDRIPPGSPPSTTTMVEDRPPVRRWSLLETLPVVVFLLLLTGLSLGSSGEPVPHVNIRMVLVTQSLLYLFILLYIHSVLRLRHRLPFWPALNWKPVGKIRFLVAGLALAVLVQFLRLPVERKLPIEQLFENRQAAFLLAAFGILIAPLVEEIIFRGFVFGAVERAWGLRYAVWTTALLFAAVHVPQLRGGTVQMLAILGVGLVLSWARGSTGSLAASYFIHLAYNTTLFVMLFVVTHGFREFG